MSWFQAFLLGIVQGITEFLPISSDGHLVLMQNFFKMGHTMLFFDVMLHLGSLGAILIFFRNDIIYMLRMLFGKQPQPPASGAAAWLGGRPEAWRYLLLMVVATIPAVIVGLSMKDMIEQTLSTVFMAGAGLLITGTVLFLGGKGQPEGREAHQMGWFPILLIGFAQAAALLPGVSRSGSTISLALLLGMGRTASARFSFFLAIPAILGASVLMIHDVLKTGQELNMGPTLLGAATAFFVGLLALALLIRLLKQGNFRFFAFYCWTIGGAALLASISFLK